MHYIPCSLWFQALLTSNCSFHTAFPRSILLFQKLHFPRFLWCFKRIHMNQPVIFFFIISKSTTQSREFSVSYAQHNIRAQFIKSYWESQPIFHLSHKTHEKPHKTKHKTKKPYPIWIIPVIISNQICQVYKFRSSKIHSTRLETPQATSNF